MSNKKKKRKKEIPKIDNFMAKFIKTDEELEKEYQENYELYKETPENMSNWLPNYRSRQQDTNQV